MQYRKSFIPLFLFILSGALAQSPGFFLDNWQPKTAHIPDSMMVQVPTETPTTTVSVHLDDTIGKIPHLIYGNNMVTWTDDLYHSTTGMKDLKNLNPHVLRWPGGNLSNVYFWNVTYDQQPDDVPDYLVNDHGIWYGQNVPGWQTSLDEYYDMRSQINADGSICVNYSYARYGTSADPVGKAAHMAAEWVRYDNGRTTFWEIGNEDFGSWQAGYEIDPGQNEHNQPAFISGELYGKHCRVFIDSMRTAAAEIGNDIKIGVVAYDAENSYDAISAAWNEGMMPEVGDMADFLIVHSYFTPHNQDSPVGTILESHKVPEEIYAAVEADMQEAGMPMLPVAMTEWNIFATGSGQQTSHVNGMLAAITLGEYVQNNYGMTTRWDLTNGWNENGDDHGTFSSGEEPGVDPLNPRPVFYYMYYHQRFFGDHMVAATVTGNESIVAHASTFSSGEKGIVMVNKSPDRETITIDLLDSIPGLNYYYYVLTGGTDHESFSRKVLINGAETDETGGGPDNYEEIKAYASSTLNGITVEMPPFGAIYLMIEKTPEFEYRFASLGPENTDQIRLELTRPVETASNLDGFQVTINQSSEPSILFASIDPLYSNVIILQIDQELSAEDEVSISYSGNGILSKEGKVLPPFSNKAVENRIPGGPYQVIINVIDHTTSENIQGATVSAGEESVITNDQGEALFNLLEGTYKFKISADGYKDLYRSGIKIMYDTVIPAHMILAEFDLTLTCIDSITEAPLEDAIISGSDFFIATDANGSVNFENIIAGDFTFNASKTGYFDKNQTIQIKSDTSLLLKMTPSHSEIKFRVRYAGQPVAKALIVLGSDSLETSAVGTCTFELVENGLEFNYKLEKQHFFDVTDSLMVSADTTIEITMEKSAAHVEFIFESLASRLENTHVIIESDTAWYDPDKPLKFYNLPIFETYNYTIEGAYYDTREGSIELTSDTVVLVSYTGIGDRNVVPPQEMITVYPNPSGGQFHLVTSNLEILHVWAIDMQGTRQKIGLSQEKDRHMTVNPGLPPGNYILLIETENGTYHAPLIIDR